MFSVPHPADESGEARVIEMARRVFEVMTCPDVGRVDIRLNERRGPLLHRVEPPSKPASERFADGGGATCRARLQGRDAADHPFGRPALRLGATTGPEGRDRGRGARSPAADATRTWDPCRTDAHGLEQRDHRHPRGPGRAHHPDRVRCPDTGTVREDERCGPA